MSKNHVIEISPGRMLLAVEEKTLVRGICGEEFVPLGTNFNPARPFCLTCVGIFNDSLAKPTWHKYTVNAL